MRNPLKLFVEMLKQPLWVIAWVNTLVIVNMFGLNYFDQVLAKWIVGIFLLQTIFMMVLYSYYGYKKDNRFSTYFMDSISRVYLFRYKELLR